MNKDAEALPKVLQKPEKYRIVFCHFPEDQAKKTELCGVEGEFQGFRTPDTKSDILLRHKTKVKLGYEPDPEADYKSLYFELPNNDTIFLNLETLISFLEKGETEFESEEEKLRKIQLPVYKQVFVGGIKARHIETVPAEEQGKVKDVFRIILSSKLDADLRFRFELREHIKEHYNSYDLSASDKGLKIIISSDIPSEYKQANIFLRSRPRETQHKAVGKGTVEDLRGYRLYFHAERSKPLPGSKIICESDIRAEERGGAHYFLLYSRPYQENKTGFTEQRPINEYDFLEITHPMRGVGPANLYMRTQDILDFYYNGIVKSFSPEELFPEVKAEKTVIKEDKSEEVTIKLPEIIPSNIPSTSPHKPDI